MTKFFDYRRYRELETIRRMTQPLEELQRFSREIERTTSVTRLAQGISQIAQMGKTVDIASHLAAPVSIELAAQKLVDPLHLRTVDVVSSASKIMGGLEISKSLVSDYLRAMDLHSVSLQIQEMFASSEIDTKAFGISTALNPYIESLRDIQGHLARSFNQDLFRSFSKDLRESIYLSLAALREGVIGPATGLMIADPLKQHGIFSWEWPSDKEPIFGSAIFFAARPSLQQIPSSSRELFIECHISCSICGDPMLVENEERYWNSPRKLTISIDIVPLCSACTQRANGSPEYWSENLSHLIERERPLLRLIRGRGTGGTGSKRRDYLRVVRPEENED